MCELSAVSCRVSTTSENVSSPNAAISSMLCLYLSIQSMRWICMAAPLKGNALDQAGLDAVTTGAELSGVDVLRAGACDGKAATNRTIRYTTMAARVIPRPSMADMIDRRAREAKVCGRGRWMSGC